MWLCCCLDIIVLTTSHLLLLLVLPQSTTPSLRETLMPPVAAQWMVQGNLLVSVSLGECVSWLAVGICCWWTAQVPQH